MLQHARDAIDNREPEAETGWRFRVVAAPAPELVEDQRDLVFGNAHAGIPHFDEDARAASAAADQDPHPAGGDGAAASAAADQHLALARVAEGVADEVLQNPAEQSRVRTHGDARGD